MYWDDKYGTRSVSPDVSYFFQLKFASPMKSCFILFTIMALMYFHMQIISNIRVMMAEESNNAVSSSFLLDDDSR